MVKILVTYDVDERNAKIVELYNKGIKYSYTDKRNDGTYEVKYEEE